MPEASETPSVISERSGAGVHAQLSVHRQVVADGPVLHDHASGQPERVHVVDIERPPRRRDAGKPDERDRSLGIG
jgi:hypothetical protein